MLIFVLEIKNEVWFHPYTDVYCALYTQNLIPEVCEKTPQANHWGGIQTHDLARADVLPQDHQASLMDRGSLNPYQWVPQF